MEFGGKEDNIYLYIYILNTICKSIMKNMTIMGMFEVMFDNINSQSNVY